MGVLWELRKISAKEFTSKWGPQSRSHRSPVAGWPSKRLSELNVGLCLWPCRKVHGTASTLQPMKLEQKTHLAWTSAPRTVSWHMGVVSSHWDYSHLYAAWGADTRSIAVGDFRFLTLDDKGPEWWLLDQSKHEELGSMKNPIRSDWPVEKM